METVGDFVLKWQNASAPALPRRSWAMPQYALLRGDPVATGIVTATIKEAWDGL
jgi:hypothetical protein